MGEEIDRERPEITILYEDNFNYLSKMFVMNASGSLSMIEIC
jgi:hypothetical protein